MRIKEPLLILLFIFGLNQTCFSAVTYDTTSTSNQQSSTTGVLFNHTLSSSANTGLFVAIFLYTTGTTVTGVNWDNAGTPVALSLVDSGNITGGTFPFRVEVWGSNGSGTPLVSGTKQIAVMLSGSNAHWDTRAASFIGVDQTTLYDGVHDDFTSSGTNTITLTGTTDNANSMLFSVSGATSDTMSSISGSPNNTPGSFGLNNTNNVRYQTGRWTGKAGSGEAVTQTFSGTLLTHAMILVNVREVGAGSGTTIHTLGALGVGN